MISYEEFVESKSQFHTDAGFEALWMPDFLYDFQKHLVTWALMRGRAAIFAGCGLGKTPMQLVFAENVARKTNKPTLILTPLAVGYQTVQEAEKFGIEAHRSLDGTPMPNITIGIVLSAPIAEKAVQRTFTSEKRPWKRISNSLRTPFSRHETGALRNPLFSSPSLQSRPCLHPPGPAR